MCRSALLIFGLALLLNGTSVALARQSPFSLGVKDTDAIPNIPSSSSQSGLSGRFLHVTDFHPDPHYKVASAISSGCHSNKPKKDKQRAGYWGSPVSGCDSPPQLVQASMAWIQDNWLPSKNTSANDQRSSFDFVIWTGDSARHDLDSKYPRTRKEIYDLNRWCLSLLQSSFPGTPIVPTIGNNDIFPHNIMWPGPNEVTSAYADIWADLIPEYQLHTFQLGGYFSREVIPGQLAIISMNTIYWYDSNKVVDGCKNAKKRRDKRARKGKGKSKKRTAAANLHNEYDDGVDFEWLQLARTNPEDLHDLLKARDPGTIHLEWLEAQIEQYRKRGIHVHLIGHVPPTAGNYFTECYDVYTDIVLHNQETVIGQHFGHMNVDAFFVQEDTEAVKHENKKGHAKGSPRTSDAEEMDQQEASTSSLVSQGFADDLRKDYEILPGAGRTNLSYYHYFFEAPSIVPTYLPSIRVWTYNVTGVELGRKSAVQDSFDDFAARVAGQASRDGVNIDVTTSSGQTIPFDPLHASRRKHRRPKHRHRKSARSPRYVDAHSPARSNQPLSLLGYSQWILDLAKANKEWDGKKSLPSGDSDVSTQTYRPPQPQGHLEFGLEYATYTPEMLWGDLLDTRSAGKDTAPSRIAPVPRHLLERELSRRDLGVQDLIEGDSDEVDDEYNNTTGRALLRGKNIPKSLRHLTEYSLQHVTVSEVLALARRLAVDDKLWKRYEKRLYQDSGVDD